jgi:hypothetical protein
MALDSKIPEGPISEKWTNYKDHINLVNPANKRKSRRNHCGYGIGRRFCSSYLWQNWVITLKHFASRIPRVARTRSQRKAESMQQKLPRRWRLHFQIVLRHRKKEGITAPGSQRTVWQKCQQTSLTSVWRKACRWLANTADC